MQLPEKLYHLTVTDHLGNICINGLSPRIGPNSLLSKEPKAALYLCTEKDIETWQILTKANTCLEIDTSYLDPKTISDFNYGEYSEIIVHESIDAKAIVGYTALPEPDQNGHAMTQLAKGYLFTMSMLCGHICQTEYHLKNPHLEKEQRECFAKMSERLSTDTLATIRIAERINFKTLTNKSASKIIRFQSNEICGISLADTYLNPDFYDTKLFPDAGVRCWEHLDHIDKKAAPALVTPGHLLYRCIKTNVPYYARTLKHVGGFAPAIFKI